MDGSSLRPNEAVHHSGLRMASWPYTARQSSQWTGVSWTFKSGGNDKLVLPTHNARRSTRTKWDCRSVPRIGILVLLVIFLPRHFGACATATFIIRCLWWRTALITARLSTCGVMVLTCFTCMTISRQDSVTHVATGITKSGGYRHDDFDLACLPSTRSQAPE